MDSDLKDLEPEVGPVLRKLAGVRQLAGDAEDLRSQERREEAQRLATLTQLFQRLCEELGGGFDQGSFLDLLRGLGDNPDEDDWATLLLFSSEDVTAAKLPNSIPSEGLKKTFSS